MRKILGILTFIYFGVACKLEVLWQCQRLQQDAGWMAKVINVPIKMSSVPKRPRENLG